MCFLSPLCPCPAQPFVSVIAQAVSAPCPCPWMCIPGGHSVHGGSGDGRVCCWPWHTPVCPRGQGGTESLPFSLRKGPCVWLVCHFAVWSRRFGDVFVGQSRSEESLGVHIPVLSQHFCSAAGTASLPREPCLYAQFECW